MKKITRKLSQLWNNYMIDLKQSVAQLQFSLNQFIVWGIIYTGLFIFFVMLPATAFSQPYDLLLKGGHVIDAKNEIDTQMDVAINDDMIARVTDNIPEAQAEKIIDVTGLYVVPGLVDIHTHVFHGTDQDRYLNNSYYAVPPDNYSFKNGVTTMVDAGGSGWKNFEKFKEQTIDNSRTRVLSFLNIIGAGMKGGHFEQNLNDMDPKMTALVARQNAEYIVGFKIAHYRGHDWEPIHRLVEAGERASMPVMVDFGSADPPLSLQKLVMEKLRPGDIYTHTYGGGGSGREAIVDESGRLRDGMLEAQQRGVIFDVGHGGASFRFKHAIPAFEQGFKPNTISTDLHQGSANAGMKNMLNVMSKFLNMDMSLQEVVKASTWKPAQVIQRPDLGHLSEGAVADVAVLSLNEGEFGFVEARPPSLKMIGDKMLKGELTLRAGQIVWDLNGISADLWK